MRRHYLKILLVVIVSGLLAGACLVRSTPPGHRHQGVSEGKHKKAKPAKHKKQKDHKKHKNDD